jgi:hypothetical protein
MTRYYADLNPSYGARAELRWVVFDRATRRPVPRAIAAQRTTRQAAERLADKLNDIEDFNRSVIAERHAGA